MKTLAFWPAVIAILFACSNAPQPVVQSSGPITVENAWMPVVPGARMDTLAVYMTIRNSGEGDQLVSVSSDLARAEMHETVNTNGFMTMRPIAGVDLPARGSVEFKPAGLHIMLLNPRRELRPGDKAGIQLVFKSGRAMNVSVIARER
jgi:hypothetical protein